MKGQIKINTGSDFSGVGAFDQALERLGIEQNKLFACDMDKYARQTYIYNFGEPVYFPENVYDRAIPETPLDIYMTSPPCQSFSLAGKRKGEDSKNGVLFYNSHEFIKINKPRFFIFENVKGLLSDDGGKTFQRWIDYLGGKSANGNSTIFPHEESVPYHVYYQVLNAKHYGIPQNRERIFIIGIRDDEDNDFSFPKPFPLTKRLKDVLESEVDEKYFLSDKMVEGLISSSFSQERNRIQEKKYSDTILSRDYKSPKCIKTGFIKQDTQASQVFSENGTSPSICAGTHRYALGYVETEPKILGYTRDAKGIVTARHEKDLSGTIHTASGGGGNTDQFVLIPANNSKGFEKAEEEEEDSINFSVPNSKTRRGRVGKKVSQTLDTSCNQGILTKQLSKQQLEKFNSLELDENIAGCITHAIGRMGSSDEYISSVKRNALITQRIRRLTPLECFRLMDFNKNFKWNVSDSQAYKQAGNSICVGVLAEIIKRLRL